MISTDADKALRPALRPEDGHLYLLRDSTRDRDDHSLQEGQANHSNHFNNGVGSIQIIRPLNEASNNPVNTDDTLMYDDGLSAARGMLLGIALGIGFWSLIGGLVGILLF
jgi:hypothetical protein